MKIIFTALIIFLILLLVFLSAKEQINEPSFTEISTNKHYVIGCNIYNENLKLIRSFVGDLCIFLDDGSFISTMGGESKITRFGPTGEKTWERNFFVHHSLVLSNDKKRVLFLSSQAREEEICLVRDDVFVVLNVENGKTIIEKSARNFHKKLFRLNIQFPQNYWGVVLMKIRPQWNNTNCEATHFNAFYEVPPNTAEKSFKPLTNGNYIASSAMHPYFFIFDKNMKKIINHKSPSSKAWVQYHDAQVLPDGKVLYYENDRIIADGSKHTAIFKFDMQSGFNQLIFPADLEAPRNEKKTDTIEYSAWAGSVQQTNYGYLIGHSHYQKGGMVIFTDKMGKILKQVSNPLINLKTKIPFDFQGVKEFDLSNFLKTNKI